MYSRLQFWISTTLAVLPFEPCCLYLFRAGVWACWLLLFEYALMGQVAILRKTHLQPYTKPPRLSWIRMLAENSLGFLGWTWTVGLVAAWLNPGAEGGWQWDYSCPNLLLLGYYASACMMLYDAYSYPLHKWMHQNKTAFRLMHMKHHGEGATWPAAGLAVSARVQTAAGHIITRGQEGSLHGIILRCC